MNEFTLIAVYPLLKPHSDRSVKQIEMHVTIREGVGFARQRDRELLVENRKAKDNPYYSQSTCDI